MIPRYCLYCGEYLEVLEHKEVRTTFMCSDEECKAIFWTGEKAAPVHVKGIEPNL